MLWILISIAVIAAAYYFLIKPHNYWKERGVVQKNDIPIFGDNWGTITRKQSFFDMVIHSYNKVKNTRYIGIYQFFTPTLLIKDPELIKQLTVKDFDHFQDHRPLIKENADPLWGKNLFSLTGQRWRDMRATLSPSFTSSKMKSMFVLISECAENFVQHFVKKGDDEIESIEMKNIFTRFTNDVIATTAFGIKVDSLNDPKNEFYCMGKEVTDFSKGLKTMKFMVMLMAPKLAEILKIRLFDNTVANFFRNLVKDTIQTREKNGIVRPDMIHLLMEARKNGIKHEDSNGITDAGFATVEESDIGKAVKYQKPSLTDEDITAQALIFFFAGFDSVSALMCFMSYELVVNQDVQEKLRQEIDETLESCNGKLTYDALFKMKYMDMVVSETLRKWPNAIAADRVVTKPYTIEAKSPEETPIHLKVGDVIWIPTAGIHRDPEYYPNPDKFDPERFSEENKNKINPYTYLPFGVGPRNCIGSRFALMETKTVYFHILSHFELVRVDKTDVPLKLAKKSFNMTAENGFWLGLKRRSKSK